MAKTTIVADFNSSITAKWAIGATTGTITSATDDDGVALPTGRYGFTIDRNNSAKEYITCTLTGTSLTDIKTVSRQGVETSGTVREHRKGAEIVITDFVAINEFITASADTTFTGDLTFDGDATFNGVMNFSNIGDVNVNGKSNPAPVVADTTARDALYTAPVTGDMVYVTALNAMQVYNTGTAQWDTLDVGTPTPDASTTVSGIVEIATDAEVTAGTLTGTTGAVLSVTPTQIKKSISLKGAGTTFTDTDEIAVNISGEDKRITGANLRESIPASTTLKGTVELATDAEAIAQSDTARAVTPSNIASVTKFNSLVFPISQPYLTGFYSSAYTTRRATCDITGISSTNRLYVSVSDATNSAYIHSFKLVGGNLIRTSSNGVGVSNNNTVPSIAVLGNYVYFYVTNAVGLYRFDKDTLTNPTLMTISGTALTDNTEIWSDGTYIYNSTGKKYSISGTTATYVSAVSYTSIVGTEPVWSDGTYVYQLSLGTTSTIIYRWDVAGGARTTLVSLLNVIDAATPVVKGLVKQAGIDLFVGMFSDSSTSNLQLRLLPTS